METFWLLGERTPDEQEKHTLAATRKIHLHHSSRKNSNDNVVSRKRAKEERLRLQESGSEASSIPTRRQQRHGNRRSVNFDDNEFDNVDLDGHVHALSAIPSSRESSQRPSLVPSNAATPLELDDEDVATALTSENLQALKNETPQGSKTGSVVSSTADYGSERSMVLPDGHRSESVL